MLLELEPDSVGSCYKNGAFWLQTFKVGLAWKKGWLSRKERNPCCLNMVEDL